MLKIHFKLQPFLKFAQKYDLRTILKTIKCTIILIYINSK